jgi:chromosome segregation ATPase
MVFGVLDLKPSQRDADLIDDLRQRNETLELQVKCAKDELTSRDSKMQALDRKVRRLEERLEHAETESRCSDELIDELQENKILLEGEMRQLKIEFDERISEIESMEQGLDQLEQEKAVAKGVSSELMVGLKEKNEELERKLEELESRKAEARKDLDYLEEDLRHAEEQLDSAELKTMEAHRQMMDLEQEHEKALIQIHDLEQKNEELEKQTSEFEISAMEWRQQRSALQEEKKEMKRQLTDFKKKSKLNDENLPSLITMKEKLREIEQSNVVLLHQLSDLQEEKQIMASTHAFSLKAKEDLLNVVEESHQSLKAELTYTKEDLSKRIHQVKELEDKCIVLAQSNDGSGDAKDEIMVHLQKTNQELQVMIKDHETEKEIWESEILCLKRRILELEDESVGIHTLEQRNETLSNALKKAQDDRDDCKSRIIKLEINCEQFEKEVGELNAEHRRIEELEHRLSQEDDQYKASTNELADKNKMLNKQLHKATSDLVEKNSELQTWVNYSRNLETQKKERVGSSDQRLEQLEAERNKMSRNIEESKKQLESREKEVQTLRNKIRDLEEEIKEGHKAEALVETINSLKHDLDLSEKQRVKQISELKSLTEKNVKLKEHADVASSPAASALPSTPYPIERVISGHSTGSNSERVDQKWQKYAHSVEKLSSRNDKLQIDLEDTRHRISLVSKDISKRVQRGEDSPYFSKMMYSLKKLSYRNDQLQIDLNEARAKVMSLHDEQTRTNNIRDEASQDSSSLLVERSQMLHQLATRHKDLHLELVKSRNHVIHLQKELKSAKFGASSGQQRPCQNKSSMPSTSARQRQILSHVPQHIVASNGRNDEVSTIMDSCAHVSKCSI